MSLVIHLSKIIKGALHRFLRRSESASSPYILGKQYFGRYGSGRNELSINGKRILKEKLLRKKIH